MRLSIFDEEDNTQTITYLSAKVDHGRAVKFTYTNEFRARSFLLGIIEQFNYHKIGLVLDKFQKALNQIIQEFDLELLTSIIGKKLDQLNKLGFQLDINFSYTKDGKARIRYIANYKELLDFYKSVLSQNINALKAFSVTLSKIILIKTSNNIKRNLKLLSAIGLDDPIDWASRNRLNVAGDDPIVWAFKNNQLIASIDPIIFAIQNRREIEGLEAELWILRNVSHIYNEFSVNFLIRKRLLDRSIIIRAYANGIDTLDIILKHLESIKSMPYKYDSELPRLIYTYKEVILHLHPLNRIFDHNSQLGKILLSKNKSAIITLLFTPIKVSPRSSDVTIFVEPEQIKQHCTLDLVIQALKVYDQLGGKKPSKLELYLAKKFSGSAISSSTGYHLELSELISMPILNWQQINLEGIEFLERIREPEFFPSRSIG